ncbi:RagB/SusD family nutrient uptake outer membrane protein [Labilibaculum euxinus]
MKRFIFIIILALSLGACEDFLDPRPIQDQTSEDLWSHATYGEGILTTAYDDLEGSYISEDYFTDNAVPNVPGSNSLAMGSWNVQSNPIGNWRNSYKNIRYLNLFIENAKDLVYKVSDSYKDSTLKVHRMGEAYFLRAWYQWQLLRDYGGYASGETEALGFPIVTRVLEQGEDLDLPRNTYEECVQQIASDCDSAIKVLPIDYLNGTDEFTGLSNRGRGSASAALALKARMYVYAASPAFSAPDQAKWVRAAKAAAEAIEVIGGLTELDEFGNFNDFSSPDNIWINPTESGSGQAYGCYPPSLYGSGNCNPSQELVNSFPAKDGYPISQSSLYKANTPYSKRDGRFERFIFFNEDLYNGTYIRTVEGGADAPGGLSQHGTRTGYYMKKLISKKVRLTPGDYASDIYFYVYMAKNELYLNFAEAANEAYGPTDASLGFSALEALQKIRERAGIDSDTSREGYQDQYVENTAALGTDAFRDLVKNERRLELCFEGHRFWDIRRWNDSLNHIISGVNISYSDQPLEQEKENIGLRSVPSTDYISSWEDINSINNGFDNPATSNDNSRGIYGNWYSGGEWRYIQYDFPQYPTSTGVSRIYTVDQSDVYWFSDGGGILTPDSVYVEAWDVNLNQWVEVSNWVGYGREADEWNVTTFDPVSTDKIRLHMKSDTESTGVIEWRVWGTKTNPASYNYQYQQVEAHSFQDYMRYVPVPYTETLIMQNLKQNKGW